MTDEPLTLNGYALTMTHTPRKNTDVPINQMVHERRLGIPPARRSSERRRVRRAWLLMWRSRVGFGRRAK